MAEYESSIFNQKAAEKLRSPDDLNKYVRVTNPSVWVVLFAFSALIVGLLSWGVFGSVTTSVSATGVVVNGEAMCFLSAEDVVKVDEGDAVIVDGKPMTVSEIAAMPLSRGETDSILKSDFLVSSLVKGDWAYQVVFSGDSGSLASGVPLSVSITVERIAPINLIFGGEV